MERFSVPYLPKNTEDGFQWVFNEPETRRPTVDSLEFPTIEGLEKK